MKIQHWDDVNMSEECIELIKVLSIYGVIKKYNLNRNTRNL